MYIAAIVGRSMCECGHYGYEHRPSMPIGECIACDCQSMRLEHVIERGFWATLWAWVKA